MNFLEEVLFEYFIIIYLSTCNFSGLCNIQFLT